MIFVRKSIVLIVLAFLSALLVITGCASDAALTPSSIPTRTPDEETETLIDQSQTPAPAMIEETGPSASEWPVFKLPVEEYSYSELGIQTPCSLSMDLIGERIILAGMITEIGEYEGGINGNIMEPMCDVGFWVDPHVVAEMIPSRLELIKNGAELLIRGEIIETEENPGEPLMFVHTLSAIPPTVTEMVYDDWANHPNSYLLSPDILDGIDGGADIVWLDKLASDDILSATRLAHSTGVKSGIFISIVDIEWDEREALEIELADAVAIDMDGNPIFDDNFGYVFDTNHPQWQEFILQKLKEAVDAGVDAVFIDDNEGNGALSNSPLGEGAGGVYSEISMQLLREFLKSRYTPTELAELGISDIETFNYSQYLADSGFSKTYVNAQIEQQWIGAGYNPIDIPLFNDFQEFQNQSTYEFLDDLICEVKNYAIETRGREILFTGFPLDILSPSNYA